MRFCTKYDLDLPLSGPHHATLLTPHITLTNRDLPGGYDCVDRRLVAVERNRRHREARRTSTCGAHHCWRIRPAAHGTPKQHTDWSLHIYTHTEPTSVHLNAPVRSERRQHESVPAVPLSMHRGPNSIHPKANTCRRQNIAVGTRAAAHAKARCLQQARLAPPPLPAIRNLVFLDIYADRSVTLVIPHVHQVAHS
jgi:hypothetical protein